MMVKRKRKEAGQQAAAAGPARIAVPELPRLPELERAFFDMLLQALSGGLQEVEKLAKKPAGSALLHKCGQVRGTVAYAQALLRLEALRCSPRVGETAQLPAVLNDVLNGLRREFLYAGVAVRRPPDEPLLGVAVPRELTVFLLEEMVTCGLRCSPGGKNLYIGARRIGEMLLLSLRTEGEALLQPPLIPLLTEEPKDADAAAAQEDYGFAMCRAVAALAGWEFRWEADEAGVRMFLDTLLDSCIK